jgi:CIC family chloride channel protein
LGVLAGFVSVFHARNFKRVEHFFSVNKKSNYKKALFGGTLLAIMIFFFPTLFGEGYESIKVLSSANPEVLLNDTLLSNYQNNDWVLLFFIGTITLLKSFATGLTLGSGGNGGNFAPSLFVGSYLGFFVSKSIHLLGISNSLPIANFTIVGMAGILSGLFRAPLTAIFLIGEITGGYDLMVPLMIVSSISFAVAKRFEKYAMDVKDLAVSGDVFTDDKDKNILQSIDVVTLIDTNAKTIKGDAFLRDLIVLFMESKQEFFPVLDENNKLLGVVTAKKIKTFLFQNFKHNPIKVFEIIEKPENIAFFGEGIEKIIKKFGNSNHNEIVVVQQDIFLGILSKLKILEAYRKNLKEMTL